MITVDAPSTIVSLVQAVGTVPGKKALQKLLYLLQEAEGINLGLSFEMYHYGPYSTELEWITQDLQAQDLLEIQSGSPQYRIRTRAETAGSLSTEAVQAIAERFGHQKPWELELLASLHFLARLKPYSGSRADREQVISKLVAWKGTKFKPDEIDWAISRLETEGYLPK